MGWQHNLNGKQTSEDFRGFPEILETCAELSLGEIQPTFWGIFLQEAS